MPLRATASPIAKPCLSWMKATSSTMKTPGSRIADRSSTTRSGLDQPVAAAVEGPGAAERAVPRAAARELDRGAGVEYADEILAAMAQEVARRPHARRGCARSRAAGPRRRRRRRRARGRHRRGRRRDAPRSSPVMPASPSPFSTQSIAPSPCSQDRARDEGGAVAADADERARQLRLRRLGEVDDLRNVGEVVARERDDVRPPAPRACGSSRDGSRPAGR